MLWSGLWMLTIGYDLKINLLHPFTRKQMAMPSYLSFKQEGWHYTDWERYYGVSFFVKKAVMLSNPLSNSYQDCVILAIYSEGKLAFARPGDEIWTHLNSERIYKDVIYFKGNFYAVDRKGRVFICDIRDENNPKVTNISCTPIIGREMLYQMYLGESSGHLLVVVRHRRSRYGKDVPKFWSHYNETFGFSIYKLEESYNDDKYPYGLRRIDNLGDESLFLGINASTSLSSLKCIKPNCIYFSEDNSGYYTTEPYGGGRDTGIFDVESKSITLHYAAEFSSHLTPPLWLI